MADDALDHDRAVLERPRLITLFVAFGTVALSGFGGVLPWTRRMIVDRRRWMTAEEFNDAYALCNFLPGPNVVNVSIVVGARFHGVRGSLAAFAGLLTLPIVAILTLAVLYERFGQLPGIDAVLRGVGAAAAGLISATGLRMATALSAMPRSLVFVAITFVAIAILRWPLIPVLLGLAPLSVLAAAWARRP